MQENSSGLQNLLMSGVKWIPEPRKDMFGEKVTDNEKHDGGLEFRSFEDDNMINRDDYL